MTGGWSASAAVVRSLPDRLHGRSHAGELLEVLAGELAEAPGAETGDGDAHDAMVLVVLAATHQACGLRSVDELDDTVVAEEQLGREITHGRVTGFDAAADGEEELVLCGSDPGVDRPLLGPVEVAAETGAEGLQSLVVRVREHWHRNIVTR